MSSTHSDPPSLEILIINIILYSLLLLIAGFLLCFEVSKQDETTLRLSSVPKFIIIACILRIIWFVSEYEQYGSKAICKDFRTVVGLSGRLAQLLLFSAFSNVLFFWWEILIRDRRLNAEDIDFVTNFINPRTVDLVLNFWVYIVLFGLSIDKFFTCDQNVRQTIDKAETVTLAFFFGLLAIGFFLIGTSLRKRLALRESTSSLRIQHRIFMISNICIVLFAIRTVMFLLNPLFGIYLSGIAQAILYPWFFYSVPEVVPSLIVLYFMIKRKKKRIALEDALIVAPLEESTDSSRVWRI